LTPRNKKVDQLVMALPVQETILVYPREPGQAIVSHFQTPGGGGGEGGDKVDNYGVLGAILNGRPSRTMDARRLVWVKLSQGEKINPGDGWMDGWMVLDLALWRSD
jgi:hypothetical protein